MLQAVYQQLMSQPNGLPATTEGTGLNMYNINPYGFMPQGDIGSRPTINPQTSPQFFLSQIDPAAFLQQLAQQRAADVGFGLGDVNRMQFGTEGDMNRGRPFEIPRPGMTPGIGPKPIQFDNFLGRGGFEVPRPGATPGTLPKPTKPAPNYKNNPYFDNRGRGSRY